MDEVNVKWIEEEEPSLTRHRPASRLSLFHDRLGDNYVAYEILDEVTETSQEPAETASNYKRRWRTIRVVYLTVFFNSVGFSIVMPSLWPFLQKVDSTASITFLGWVVAAYGLAQLVGSFFFGYWCQHRPSREPLLAGIGILMIGSGFYAFVQAFPNNRGYVILAARILLGFSGGKSSVCKAVVSQSTTLHERTAAMANLALFKTCGLMVGPAVQGACVPIGDEGVFIKSLKLYLNIYNAPGYIGIIMAVINILCIVFFYRDRKLELQLDSLSPQEENNVETSNLKNPDPWAIFLVTILYFITITTFALNETIMTPVMMDEYAWKREDAVLYGAILTAVSGVISIVCFVGVKPLSKRYSERKILVAIMGIMLVGMFLCLPWGNKYPILQIPPTKAPNNGSTILSTSAQVLGCPSQYHWCKTTPKLYLTQYIIGTTFVLGGFSIAVLLLITIYSKLLGPRRQGNYMGWITAVGSLARGLGPVVVTIIYVHGGPRWTFLMVTIMLAFALILLGILFKKLVPFHEYTRRSDVI